MASTKCSMSELIIILVNYQYDLNRITELTDCKPVKKLLYIIFVTRELFHLRVICTETWKAPLIVHFHLLSCYKCQVVTSTAFILILKYS